MNDKDFEIIESQFNIKLPKEYKEAVMANPFRERKYNSVKDSLYVEREKIIEANKTVRSEGYCNKKWPKYLFIIGSSGENTYTVIDLRQQDNVEVYAVIHEDQEDRDRIKKVRLGSNFIVFINNKKIVSECI